MNKQSIKKLKMVTAKLEQVMTWVEDVISMERDSWDAEPEWNEGGDKISIEEAITELTRQVTNLNEVSESLTETFQLV